MSKFSFCISFSGITLRFTLPTKINIPKFFNDLLCEDTDTPTAEYQVELLNAPLRPEGCAVYDQKDFSVYETEEGTLRIYNPLTADDGCQVACYIRKSGKHTLYYPASMWAHYSQYWHCTHLLCGELLLCMNNALLLHSSVVTVNSKAVLFCGESGAGKSTQAALWAKHQNARVLNGDRCVIREKEGIFYGGGSPWCGTSGIYSKDAYPIAAIIMLSKSEENSVSRVGAKAFAKLFSQTTQNPWDKTFMKKISDLFVHIFESVPIFELKCRADKEATDITYTAVFAKEK